MRSIHPEVEGGLVHHQPGEPVRHARGQRLVMAGVTAVVLTGLAVLAVTNAPEGAVVDPALVVAFLCGALVLGTFVRLYWRAVAWLDPYGVIIRSGPRWAGAWRRIPWSAVRGVEPRYDAVRIYTANGYDIVSLGGARLWTHHAADQIRRWWMQYGEPPPPPPAD